MSHSIFTHPEAPEGVMGVSQDIRPK